MTEQEAKYSFLVCFAREARLIWLAHLDMMRLVERSMRRAELPLVWSKGFNPRPEMVFALPLGMGLEAEADLLEFCLSQRLDGEALLGRLNAVVPDGIAFTGIHENPSGGKSLMSRVSQAVYRLEGESLGRAAARLFEGDEPLSVEREHKGKRRIYDLREYLLEHEILSADVLRFRCLAGSSRNLRVDLVLDLLVERSLISRDLADDSRMIRERLILDV